MKYTLAGCARRLHRLRSLHRGLPGQVQERSQAQGHQHGSAACSFASAKRTTGISSSPCPRLRASSFRSPRSRMCNCFSRSSSSPAPAADAVKPRTSSCSRSSYGDRTVIANATGCSSIYGGNLPTTPYTFNKDGRGIAWSNSLFEDNAEFGLGMRLSIDKNRDYARELLVRLAAKLPEELVKAILGSQAERRSRNCRAARARRAAQAEIDQHRSTRSPRSA